MIQGRAGQARGDQGVSSTVFRGPEGAPSSGWNLAQWIAVGLVLVAWALRLRPALQGPLHPDEALYGYWGLLIARGRDPWLVTGTVYKPPLLPYMVALSQILLGRTTVALRLPGLMAGLAAVPLVGVLARDLYQDAGVGATASAVMALSPFGVVLSGTAFPDPVMVTLGLAACVAAARGRLRWAGLLVGLSFVTKQTGLVWGPLVLAISLGQGWGSLENIRGLLIACLVPVSCAFVWDAWRVAQGGDSFWSAGIVGYGGLRLIWSHELWPRLRAWRRLLRNLFLSLPMNGLVLVALPVLAWRGLVRRPPTRRAFFDLLLISFCLIYGLLHWLVAFPVWERYLLPLLPVLAVLLARFLGEAASRWQRAVGRSMGLAAPLLVVAALLAVPAHQASAGRSPVGVEAAPYQGVEQVLTFLKQLPQGVVVYHHWLGWHYHYALFDGPAYLAYWPTPSWLAEDVEVFGRGDPRYIAFPPWESAARVERALEEVGYGLETVFPSADQDQHQGFVVYHILPLPER